MSAPSLLADPPTQTAYGASLGGTGSVESTDPSGKYKGKNFDPNYKPRFDRATHEHGHGHERGRGRGRGRGHGNGRGHGRGHASGGSRGGRFGEADRGGRYSGRSATSRSRSRSRSLSRDRDLRGKGGRQTQGRSYDESPFPQPALQPYFQSNSSTQEHPRDLRRPPASYNDLYDQTNPGSSALSQRPRDSRYQEQEQEQGPDRSASRPGYHVDTYIPKRPSDLQIGSSTIRVPDTGLHSGGTPIDSPAQSHLPTPSLTSTSMASSSSSSRPSPAQTLAETARYAPASANTSTSASARSSTPQAGPQAMTATLDSLAKLRQFKAEVEASRIAKASALIANSAATASPAASTTASANANAGTGASMNPGLSTSVPASAGIPTSSQSPRLDKMDFDTSQLAKMAQSFIEKQQKQAHQSQPQLQLQAPVGQGNSPASVDAAGHRDVSSQSQGDTRVYPATGMDREQELREKLRSRPLVNPRSPRADLKLQDRDRVQDLYDRRDPSRTAFDNPASAARSPGTGRHLPPLPSDPRFTRREVNDNPNSHNGRGEPRDLARPDAGNTSEANTGHGHRDGDLRTAYPKRGDYEARPGERQSHHDQRDTAGDRYADSPRHGEGRRLSHDEWYGGQKLADRIAGRSSPPPSSSPYIQPGRLRSPTHPGPRPQSRSRSRSPARTRDIYAPFPANPVANRTRHYPDSVQAPTAQQRPGVASGGRLIDNDRGRAVIEDPYETYAARRGLPTGPGSVRLPASPYALDDTRHRESAYPVSPRDPLEHKSNPRYPEHSPRDPIRDPYPRRSPPPVARRHPSMPRGPPQPIEQRYNRNRDRERDTDRDWDRDYGRSDIAYTISPAGSTRQVPPPPPPASSASVGLDTNNVVETLQALKEQISKLEKLVPASLVNAVSSFSTTETTGGGVIGNASGTAVAANRGYTRPYVSGPRPSSRSRSRSRSPPGHDKGYPRDARFSHHEYGRGPPSPGPSTRQDDPPRHRYGHEYERGYVHQHDHGHGHGHNEEQDRGRGRGRGGSGGGGGPRGRGGRGGRGRGRGY
ncbi:hypothetical protein IAT40_003211 [Kwoniella sp. CBS 6097]